MLTRSLDLRWLEDDGMTDDQKIQAAVEHVGTYLALKAQIAGLEAEADVAKAAACEALETASEAPGKTWDFPGLGEVQIVKGRLTEKLDRAVLARAGVDPALLDKATVRTEGKPSVRITAAKENGDATDL